MYPPKRCSYKKVLETNLQNRIKQIYGGKHLWKCDSNKVKHFEMDFLLYICCIFSERLFIRTILWTTFELRGGSKNPLSIFPNYGYIQTRNN